jgi:hypothetical protein
VYNRQLSGVKLVIYRYINTKARAYCDSVATSGLKIAKYSGGKSGEIGGSEEGEPDEWGFTAIYDGEAGTGAECRKWNRSGGLDDEGGAEDDHEVAAGGECHRTVKGFFGERFTEKGDVWLVNAAAFRTTGNATGGWKAAAPLPGIAHGGA